MNQPTPEPEPHDRPPGRPWTRRVLGWFAELPLWIATFVVALLVMGWLRSPDLPTEAPDFTLQTLQGESITLSELRGRPVLLNFWATWCGPCRAELPTLSSWAEDHPDAVVLGVATDRDPRALRRFLAEQDLPYPVVVAEGPVQSDYGVQSLPTSVFVDPDGTIRRAHVGVLVWPMIDLFWWL